MLNQLKIANIKNILLCLLVEKRATKQVLGRGTGLSNTTVSDSINSLLKLGLVVPDGSGESIGGRRSTIYTINRAYGQFIGVELRADGLQYVVCDTLGEVLLADALPRRKGELPIQLLYRAIEEAHAAQAAPNPLAIGVGLQGAIDHENQIVLASEALGWQNVHLKEITERRFYIPTYIDSAVNGQIPLEHYINRPGGPPHLMVLHEGFPTKVAVCVDGSICRGARNLCGAITDINAAVQNAAQLAQSWDVARLVIRYQSPQYGQWAQATGHSQAEIEARPSGKEDLAQGMALLAETQWFSSIYFLLQ